MAGIHTLVSFSLDLDELSFEWKDESYKIEIDNVYSLDIFYTSRSSNHDPGYTLELPDTVLCNALSSGEVVFDFKDFENCGDLSCTSNLAFYGVAKLFDKFLYPISADDVSQDGSVWYAVGTVTEAVKVNNMMYI